MYFLPEADKKRLLRYYLPKARELGIAEELRGWNWHEPPLEPIYSSILGLYEVAGGYCSSGRDVYLRHVERIKGKPNLGMIQGSVLHDVVANRLVGVKKALYQHDLSDYRALCNAIQEQSYAIPDGLADDLTEEELQDTLRKINILSTFEKDRILARLHEVFTKYPYIGIDSLVNLTVPVIVEQRLDGIFLGLSGNLSTDAFIFSEPMILDLKFGERRDFHRLTTTGYALVMEALYEFPVNLGCIVYGEFKDDRLIIRRDIHIIKDELRQWFIEARDQKGRLVAEAIDPGLADNCYAACPYYKVCYK